MKKPVFIFKALLSFVCLLSLIYITGCSSNSAGRPGAHTLSWTFDGSTYTADEVDAYFTSFVIIATKDLTNPATMKRLEIMLIDPNSTFDMGTYSFNTSTSANSINYTVGNGGPTTALHSTDGSLTITAKTGNVISGNFSATLIGSGGSGGGVISGSFANVSID